MTNKKMQRTGTEIHKWPINVEKIFNHISNQGMEKLNKTPFFIYQI